MRRIDRYLLVQLLTVFAFFSLVLISVYWVNRAARLFDAIVGDGQSFWVFLELSALTLPNVIRVVLPLSAFAAAVYVAMRMTRDNELVVLQGTGLSYARMLRSVAIFGLVVALMLAFLMHVLMPLSRMQLAERQVQIAENISTRLLRAGEFLQPADGVVVFLREITPEGKLVDVFLSDSRTTGTRVEYSASSALLVPGGQGPALVMLDGVALIYRDGPDRLGTLSFDELTFDVGGLVGPAGRRADVRELPTNLLLSPDSDEMAALGITLPEIRFELASRFAQPLLAVMTSMIGFVAICLGQFSRLGVWRQVLGAIIVLALVQLAGNAASGFALRNAALAWLAFVPVGLGGGVVAGMLWWASRSRGTGWTARARAGGAA
ncbi:LptF/LptG family permease [Roseinatronobacter alkalisoli]|uniref:LptF/LptG family permease n=1 Tax=Roseinatronobacter alkalisoli TaxID=3028235 RepID=UPI002368BA0A|nr:LptF/LptG family permease [Roseinatronobacter sp. HJB301]